MKKSEKKLLYAINKEASETPDNYPDTDADKVGYAAYALTKSLERISPAITRLYRCESLCKVGSPNIITNNETRMALGHLIAVKCDIDDAYKEVLEVYNRTKPEVNK